MAAQNIFTRALFDSIFTRGLFWIQNFILVGPGSRGSSSCHVLLKSAHIFDWWPNVFSKMPIHINFEASTGACEEGPREVFVIFTRIYLYPLTM